MTDTHDLAGAGLTAQNIEQSVIQRTKILSDEQRKNLSKVLFPDTHNSIITLLGKERELRPLPIKISRKLSEQLNAFQIKLEKGITDTATVTDINLCDHLMSTVHTLAEFYEWDDVLADLEIGDHLTTTDLQRVLVEQTHLQETNDFLLIPLRVLVGMMQHTEIEMLNLQSIFSGLGL